MRELIEQYRELKESLSLPHTVETRREVENQLDDTAHQIAQRMLDVSSDGRVATDLRDSWWVMAESRIVQDRDLERMERAADALDLAEAEKADSDKAWEELAELMEESCEDGTLWMQNIADYPLTEPNPPYKPDCVDPYSEPLAHAQIAKAKDRIAKRGGVNS